MALLNINKALPRTFIGFSSTDLYYYHLMLGWKANEKIFFNFTNCQLEQEINSEDESYIKKKCRERINLAGTYMMLIGKDTRYKYKYVRWEAEVAMEKRCRIIGVNLDQTRKINHDLCPPIINDIGAVFVPFSPNIIAHALRFFKMKEKGNFYYQDNVYQHLEGNTQNKSLLRI